MLPVFCIKDCFWRNKNWKVGDSAKLSLYESPPSEFSYKKPVIINILPSADSNKIVLVGDGPSGKDFISSQYPVAVVNRVGLRYPNNIKYWLSLHPQLFGIRLNIRRKKNLPCDNIYFISNKVVRNPTVSIFRSKVYGGSSSLFALDTLVAMGYKEIELIGVDLTDRYEAFRVWWEDYWPKAKVITNSPGWISEWCESRNYRNKVKVNKL